MSKKKEATASTRIVSRVDRESEYLTEKGLLQQIGTDLEDWPLALLKELIDNGIDACERAMIPRPIIDVEIGDDYFSVRDNGHGLSPQTIDGVLDFSVRVSCNSQYVGPTRGQLGNALKCVVCAPSVLFPDNEKACVMIESRAVRHLIRMRVAGLSGRAVPVYEKNPAEVKNGTFVRVGWPGASRCLRRSGSLISYRTGSISNASDLLKAFCMFNPDIELRLGGKPMLVPVVELEKWRACDPTSPHWYDQRQMANLVAARIMHEREKEGGNDRLTVRDFVLEFARLTSTEAAKRVCEKAGLTRRRLAELSSGDEMDMEAIGKLVDAMHDTATVIQPHTLGWIGEENLRRGVSELYGVDAASVKYRRLRSKDESVPFVAEAAFGIFPKHKESRVVVVGVNWTPKLAEPTGHLDSWLSTYGGAMVADEDPVFLVLHIITPRPSFTDQAKSRASFPKPVLDQAEVAIQTVTKDWTVQRRKDSREERIREEAHAKMLKKNRQEEMTAKEAAWRVMPEAHAHVTGGDPNAPVMARQMFYAARKLIQALTTECFTSARFSQNYLPDYLKAHPQETASWIVAYDARGRLIEPHGGQTVELGTLAVRRYVGKWQDFGMPANGGARLPSLESFVSCLNRGIGPRHRYRNLLLIEKEGFSDLLAHHRIAQRYDLAFAWSKGFSTTAARELVEALSRLHMRIFVLHDFDQAGLSILHTLRTNNRRYTFMAEPNVIDIGLRLTDAQAMGLDGEVVQYGSRIKTDPRGELKQKGATTDEQNFLVQGGKPGSWHGRRVELNEMTNSQFISYLEKQLETHGVKKVVPDADYLSAVYEETIRRAIIESRVTQERQRIEQEERNRMVAIPLDLRSQVHQTLKERPELAWNRAIEVVAAKIIADTETIKEELT